MGKLFGNILKRDYQEYFEKVTESTCHAMQIVGTERIQYINFVREFKVSSQGIKTSIHQLFTAIFFAEDQAIVQDGSV